MTRDDDYFIGLGPRVAKAGRGLNVDLFVSIHANSMPAMILVVWRRITSTVVGVWLGRSTTPFWAYYPRPASTASTFVLRRVQCRLS